MPEVSRSISSYRYPLMPHGPRAKHVVFADALRWQRRVDLAPREERATRSTHGAFRPEDGAFVRWLFRGAGLDARHYRAETLRRRLPSCLRALRVSSSTEARRLLRGAPALIPTAVRRPLTG